MLKLKLQTLTFNMEDALLKNQDSAKTHKVCAQLLSPSVNSASHLVIEFLKREWNQDRTAIRLDDKVGWHMAATANDRVKTSSLEDSSWTMRFCWRNDLSIGEGAKQLGNSNLFQCSLLTAVATELQNKLANHQRQHGRRANKNRRTGR